MPSPLIFAAAASLLNWSCTQEKAEPKPDQPEPGAASNPPRPEAAPGPQAPEPHRSEYIPPALADRPQAGDAGVVHYPRLLEGEEEVRDSFPVSFTCEDNEEKNETCYFALPGKSKHYSFSSKVFEGKEPIHLKTEADFSRTIDPQQSQITAVARQSGFTYALFDSLPQGLNQAPPKAGIAIQSGGTSLQTFYFPDVDSRPVSCPKNLFVYHNPLSNHRELWVSTSNCRGSNDFDPGNIFVLNFRPDGTLETATDAPLVTTQFNPQAIAGWDTSTKAYILVVNTGKTRHVALGGQADEVVTDGGVDLFDPETKGLVANIPLGLTSANSITISADNKLAFVGSQVQPKLYALDLEYFSTKLAAREPEAGPQSWPDVAIADARNAIPMNWSDKAFYPEIQYDDDSQTLFVSSFNDGRLYQLKADYLTHDQIGIEVGPGFGAVLGHYLCAGEGTENCGEVELIRSGLVALTGHPAGVTFIPNSVLGRSVPER